MTIRTRGGADDLGVQRASLRGQHRHGNLSAGLRPQWVLTYDRGRNALVLDELGAQLAQT